MTLSWWTPYILTLFEEGAMTLSWWTPYICTTTNFLPLVIFKLISNCSLVQMPAGQLNCWTLFKDCVGVNCMYKLFKLGVLLPCKSLLQIWSIGWEVRVWRDAESVDPTTHNNKVATYHSWFATPFSRNEGIPTTVPQYLHLDLSKYICYAQCQ